MARGRKKTIGDLGELFVVKSAACPSCGRNLVQLPEGYPLFDLQCSACIFRCQVKATSKRPKNQILGAGWDIFEAVLKTGQPVPPLIYVADVGEQKADATSARFFPFIPRKNLIVRHPFPSGHPRSHYRQFTYVKMNEVPSFFLDDEGRWVASGMGLNQHSKAVN